MSAILAEGLEWRECAECGDQCSWSVGSTAPPVCEECVYIRYNKLVKALRELYDDCDWSEEQLGFVANPGYDSYVVRPTANPALFQALSAIHNAKQEAEGATEESQRDERLEE